MQLTKETFRKEELKQQEGAYTIGNGYMHIRGSLDFQLPFAPQNEVYWRMPANVTVEEARHPYSKWGCYIPGIVGNHPLLNEEMVNLPYPCGISLSINDVPWVFQEEEICDFRQILHMDTSEYEYEFTILHASGHIHVHTVRCCDWDDPHVLIQQISVTAESDVMLKLSCFVDMDVTTNGYQHFTERYASVQDAGMEVVVTTDAGCAAAIVQQLETSAGLTKGEQQDGCIALDVHAEKQLYVERRSSIWTTLDDNDPLSAARHHAAQLPKGPYALQAHLNKMKKLWELHRVVIEGDAQAQQALDYSVYHLMRSKPLYDTVAIDAKGAAGEAYFGHYFWDTELYLFPFFLYTEPHKAKDLLMFRVHTLQEAIENAEAYGYQGAKYPWESSISGREQCPNWQYKDHEIHVSFDIVYAMQQYYALTLDEQTCREEFFPVVEQVAKFALSRSYRSADGRVHINGVMGPDEYILFCNDNYYTNYMAAFSIQVYLDWCERYEIPCEKDAYEYFIENIHLPQRNGILEQCADFPAFEDVDFAQVWKHREKPLGAQLSQEHNYRCKALKQADTLMLFYLFDSFDQAQLQACMEYYLPITTHDSSLSYVIHSILYTRLQETEKAYSYFQRACSIDFTENGAAEGIHIANAGGLWQAVIFGFIGLQNMMWHSETACQANLPMHWNRVQANLVVQGKLYAVEITKQKTTIGVRENPYA